MSENAEIPTQVKNQIRNAGDDIKKLTAILAKDDEEIKSRCK